MGWVFCFRQTALTGLLPVNRDPNRWVVRFDVFLLTVTPPSRLALNPAYRRGIREESVKNPEQSHLERAACVAEAGQLWGVTDSELGYFAD